MVAPTQIKKNFPICPVLFLLILISLLCTQCGGGGGGGGGSADTTPPSVYFTSPNPSGNLTYEADPASLPNKLSLNYSDAGGIQPSTFSAFFSFRGITFNLTSLFTAGSASASTNSATSPLYWTIISKYNISNQASAGTINLFGVSSGSTGVLNLIDVDAKNGVLAVAATSRNKLLIINLSDGSTKHEITLTAKPTIVRTCPDYNNAFVVLEATKDVYTYSVATGALGTTITLPAAPEAMTLNSTTSNAFFIFKNSQTLATVGCGGGSATITNLDHIPQRITADGLSANKLFYAGGIGADKGVYQYASGTQTKLFALSELPEDMTYDSQLNRLFLASYSNNTVEVRNVGTGQQISQIPVGDKPFSMRSAAGAGKVFALNKGNDTVSVIDASTATVTNTIQLAADPVGLAADTTNGILYVLQNIWEISSASTGTITASVKDTAGNTGNASPLNITIKPVVTDGPGTP